jgi:hypothetical protein
MAMRQAQREFDSPATSSVVGAGPFVRAAPQIHPVANSQRPLKFLWIADVDYRLGEAHGGNLRLINFAKELRKQANETYLAVPARKTDDQNEKQNFLESLKRDNVISNYFSVEYRHPKAKGKLAHLALYPGAANAFAAFGAGALHRSSEAHHRGERDRRVHLHVARSSLHNTRA